MEMRCQFRSESDLMRECGEESDSSHRTMGREKRTVCATR